MALTHAAIQIQNSNQKMLSFLGLKVLQPITNRQRYKEALQEVRHYLSLKRDIQLRQTEYLMTIGRGDYSLQLVKNPYYLHTCHFNMPILHQEDMDFLDAGYECLMMLMEAFPSKVSIEIVTETDSKQLLSLEQRKKQEFNRRVNANLKSTAQSNSQLNNDDVEDILYLLVNSYNRKNKTVALKLLLNRLSPHNIGPFASEYLEVLGSLQEQPDLRRLVIELSTKIKSLERQNSLNKQNHHHSSNFLPQQEPLKLSSLIFQLTQSYKMERVCNLLQQTLSQHSQSSFLTKLEPAITTVSNRFNSNQYQDAHSFGPELDRLLRQFWERRGKKWEQRGEQRQKKNKEVFRQSQPESKSKMSFSRRVHM